MRKTIGFSLIELMIVVSIIGILTAIALPSYQGYAKRARFAEVMTAVIPYKIAVSLALQEGMPQDELQNGMHGIPMPPDRTNNLENLYVEHGIIKAEATELAGGYTYILKPNKDGANWHVAGTCLKAGWCEG